MDEKNIAVLLYIKKKLLAEEAKEQENEIIYPFKSSKTYIPNRGEQQNTLNTSTKKHENPTSSPTHKDEETERKMRKLKATKAQQKELAIRAANRLRVSNHKNIARSYSSGESGIHTFSGGDVRPK